MNRLLTSLLLFVAVGAQVTKDDVTPDKVPAQASIPISQRVYNTGGRDGAGLCVFTSIMHAARLQNVFQLKEFQEFMKSKPGGGYPQKVDAMIAEICAKNKWPVPAYVQVRGSDLEILKKACRSGRMVSVTYCYSPSGNYGGRRISHMVNLVHVDEKWWGILDNNYIDQIEWLSEKEFVATYMGGGGGWSVILLNPGPPPVPFN